MVCLTSLLQQLVEVRLGLQQRLRVPVPLRLFAHRGLRLSRNGGGSSGGGVMVVMVVLLGRGRGLGGGPRLANRQDVVLGSPSRGPRAPGRRRGHRYLTHRRRAFIVPPVVFIERAEAREGACKRLNASCITASVSHPPSPRHAVCLLVKVFLKKSHKEKESDHTKWLT